MIFDLFFINIEIILDSFLCKFQKKFMWLLNNLDMNKQIFYEIECEQLEILERFLSSSSSRIISFETMDYILEFLFMLKRQFLELSLNFPSSASNTTRLNTPKISAKSTKATSSSAIMVNNVLKPLLKVTGMRPESPGKQDLNPSSTTGNPLPQQGPASAFIGGPNTPFIIKEKDSFGLFLSIIATVLMKVKKTEAHQLIFKLFINNDNWNEVVRLYVTGVFSRLFAVIDEGETKNLEVYTEESAKLFVNCQKILNYYKAVSIAIQTIISKEKLVEGWDSKSASAINKDENKKEWRENIRRTFQNLVYLVRPNSGVFDQYLSVNKSLSASLISNSAEEFPKTFFIRFNLFKEVYQCITMLFSFDSSLSCLLQDDIACYYLRYSYINFVKLYSYSSNSELNEINTKINEMNNRMKKDHNLSTEQIDEIYLKKEEKQKTDDLGRKKSSLTESFKIELLKLFVRCLFALSKSRTPEISQKFYQYRILEFFTREIDLEYEVR